MFGKVFEQIYDSSIAEDYNLRRMFMDLIVLADPEGYVDMTHEAIARRTNVPLDEVSRYIALLEAPDSKSRSPTEEGRRLVKISADRLWGWRIVNYKHYREIRDQEARRAYFRDKQREHREKQKKETKVAAPKILNSKNGVTDSEWLARLKESPAYKGIDVEAHFFRCVEWCNLRKITPTRRRVLAWLNKQDKPIAGKPQRQPYREREAKINRLNQRKAELLRKEQTNDTARELHKIDLELFEL